MRSSPGRPPLLLDQRCGCFAISFRLNGARACCSISGGGASMRRVSNARRLPLSLSRLRPGASAAPRRGLYLTGSISAPTPVILERRRSDVAFYLPNGCMSVHQSDATRCHWCSRFWKLFSERFYGWRAGWLQFPKWSVRLRRRARYTVVPSVATDRRAARMLRWVAGQSAEVSASVDTNWLFTARPRVAGSSTAVAALCDRWFGADQHRRRK